MSFCALTTTTALTIKGSKPIASYSSISTTADYYFGLSPDGGITALFSDSLIGLSTKAPNDYSIVESSSGIPNTHYTYTDVDGDTDAGITIVSPSLEWKKWNTSTSTWNSLIASEMAMTFSALESAGIEKLKAIVTADSYPTSQYGDPLQGDVISPGLNKEFIVYTSDDITGLRTKYHTEANGSALADYSINVSFPKTGFNGAQFQIVLKSGSPSMYTWELGTSGSGISNNSIASVDNTGSVTLKSLGSVTVVATHKSGSVGSLTYTVNPSKWFDASYPTNTNYRTATEYCLTLTDAYYGLAARSDVTNANLTSIPPYEGIGGSSVTFPVNATYTRSATDGTLLSDWGNVSLYNPQLVGNFWALEPFTTSRAYTMSMPNSGQPNFYITTSTEDVSLPTNRVGSLIYDANYKPLCLSRVTPSSDNFDSFDVNGESFSVNTGVMGTGFPSTAFYGAEFKVTLAHGSPNDYYWFNHRPLNWTVDENSGKVRFNILYTDVTKVITPATALTWGSTVIYAIGKENTNYAGQFLKAYIDYPRKYFFPYPHSGSGSNLYWSAASCVVPSLGTGWRLPTRADLTLAAGKNIPIESGLPIPGAATPRKSSEDALISEWGNISTTTYPLSRWSNGGFLWTGERWKNSGNGWNFYVAKDYGQVDAAVDATWPGGNIFTACVFDQASLSVASDSLTGVQVGKNIFGVNDSVPSIGFSVDNAGENIFSTTTSGIRYVHSASGSSDSYYNWYSSNENVINSNLILKGVGIASLYGIGKANTPVAGNVLVPAVVNIQKWMIMKQGYYDSDLYSYHDVVNYCAARGKLLPTAADITLGGNYYDPIKGRGTLLSEYGSMEFAYPITPGSSSGSYLRRYGNIAIQGNQYVWSKVGGVNSVPNPAVKNGMTAVCLN